VFINYARQGTFSSCFQFGELARIITTNLGDYLLAWAVTIGVSVVIGIAVSILATFSSLIPCIGWILTWVVSAVAGAWGSTIYAHLFGQVGSHLPSSGGSYAG
jgi:amino acid transporter